MNKKIIITIISALCAFKGFADDQIDQYEILPIESLYSSSAFEFLGNIDKDKMPEEIIKNWQPHWVIEIKQGIEMPMKINAQSDLFHIGAESLVSNITFDKTFYIRFVEGDILFSNNLKIWKSFEKFFTGQVSASIFQDTVSIFGIGFQAFERKEDQ